MELALQPLRGIEQLEAEFGPRLLRTAVVRAKLERLALRGLTAADAAKVVGCSAQTAQKHFKDVEFRRATLGMLAGTMQAADTGLAGKYLNWSERMERAADKAYERLFDLLEAPDTEPAIVARVAQDFLDRHPKSAARATVEHTHNHNFSAEDLAHAASVAAEISGAKVVNIRKSA